jgi:hypothetical protein
MTKFADQLFDDLMQEHGPALAQASPARHAPARHAAAGRKLMLAGAGGVAVAAAATGVLVTGGGTPAYAVTTHPDGTVTLAVTEASGISGANGKLHQLGDRVVVVPVRPGCPSISSLRPPVVQPVHISGSTKIGRDGSVTVNAKGIPAGDILVVAVETNTHQANGKFSSLSVGTLTSPPAPAGVSLPAGPAAPSGSASGTGPGTSTVPGTGTGPATSTGPATGAGPETSTG